MKNKYNKDGFVIVDDFLPTDKYDELVEIFSFNDNFDIKIILLFNIMFVKNLI